MKTAFYYGLIIAAGIAACAATPNKAHAATQFNIPGTECKNYYTTDAKWMGYYNNGVRNSDSVAHTIICPIPRIPTVGASLEIWVDGYSATGYPIACVLYSYNFDGKFVASTSMAGKTGTFDTQVTVANTQWSTANLYCTLPPSNIGIIYDIDVVQ